MADTRLTSKSSISSIADDDLIHVVDVSDTTSHAAGTSKKTLWSLIKSTLKTYFDTIYTATITGTIANNQIAVGTSTTDEIEGTDSFKFDNGTLTVGEYLTDNGIVSIAGNSSIVGGLLDIHTSANNDTNVTKYTIGVFTGEDLEVNVAGTVNKDILIWDYSALKWILTDKMRLSDYGSGSVTGTPTYDLSVDASGNIIEEPLKDLQEVTDVGATTTNNIDVASVNDLELFYNIANAYIGIGDDALGSATNVDQIGIGFRAGQNSSQGQTTFLGTYAGQDNTGSSVTFVGNSSGRYNESNTATGVGSGSLGYNKAVTSTAMGTDSGLYNTGINLTAQGSSSARVNEGDNNTIIGFEAAKDFNDDTANKKDVASAATDIDTATERITITSHGFGSTGTFVNLKYTTTGTAIGGMFDSNTYQFKIIDANTIEFQGNISSVGIDTHTFTPQFVYDNITVLGANAEPTASNQVVLGDSSVTEVVMGNGEVLNNIKQVKVALTATNVNNIGTTPITAVAAPGSGKVIKVISAFANLTWGTTAFDNNTLDLETSGATNNQASIANFLNATADKFATPTLTANTDNLIANTALVIAGTDSVSTGDSTVDVYITYEIIDL